MSNKQAAEKLHLLMATVKRHLPNIYEKLKVGSRGEERPSDQPCQPVLCLDSRGEPSLEQEKPKAD